MRNSYPLLHLFIIILIGSSSIRSQCLAFNSQAELHRSTESITLSTCPVEVIKLVSFISRDFFPGGKDTATPLGYTGQYNHPAALAVPDNSLRLHPACVAIAGPNRVGYLLLDNDWIINSWKQENYRLHPPIIFLIAHEITHLLHYNDWIFQRRVSIDTAGKASLDTTRQGRYRGFFHVIPDSLQQRAKELHADYAAGIIVYDMILSRHDSWQASKYDRVRSAHAYAYAQSVEEVVSFIEQELANYGDNPRAVNSHGTAAERVAYFRKGVQDRRADLAREEKANRRAWLARAQRAVDVERLLTAEMMCLIEKFARE